jgi:demethylmenaquinone methyltransferase/2-methoxy-6-polyprenyl-1,4-benzoquinol methylase
VKAYYDRRAPEYDDWYLGVGRFADRDRPGWHEELAALVDALAALPPARTLDVACGTGFLTRHLRGEVTLLDQSEAMLEIARERVPAADAVAADALPLPFPDGSFERVFTGHFYGHLQDEERASFLAEARRLAPELVVVDSAGSGERMDERVLSDGSRWAVYKRWFGAASLAEELGGGEPLFDGDWFVAVRA